MRTTTFGVLLVLGSIGALTANGVTGCTYTAAGQGADAAPPSIENGGDGGYYGGSGSGGGTGSSGGSSSGGTGSSGGSSSGGIGTCGGDCGDGFCCNGACCETSCCGGTTCCPSGSECNGDQCISSPPVCGEGEVLCGSGTPFCCPGQCCGDSCCPATADASPGCGPGLTYCPSDGCTNVQTDQNNCGNCGMLCQPGQTCTNGSCAGGCMPPPRFATDCAQYVGYVNDTATQCQTCLKQPPAQNCMTAGAGTTCGNDLTNCQQSCMQMLGCTSNCPAGPICQCVANCLSSPAMSSGTCCMAGEAVVSCVDSACASSCGAP